jgi:hypothetical protein
MRLPLAARRGLAAAMALLGVSLLSGTVRAEILEEIVAKVNNSMITRSQLQERLAKLGATVAAPNERSPQWLGDFVKSEVKKWEAPIKASGVQVE